MPKKRFSAEQIVTLLRQIEVSIAVRPVRLSSDQVIAGRGRVGRGSRDRVQRIWRREGLKVPKSPSE
jgi:hypothetical protein